MDNANLIVIVAIAFISILYLGKQPFQGALDSENSINVTLKYNADYLEFRDDCFGEVAFAPDSSHLLTVCANDGLIDYGCKSYTSGILGTGTNISTDYFIADKDASYRLKFHWKRIQYVNMDDSSLDGHYDSGQVYSSSKVIKCGNPETDSSQSYKGQNKANCEDKSLGSYYLNGDAIDIYDAPACGGTEYLAAEWHGWSTYSPGGASCRKYEGADIIENAAIFDDCVHGQSYEFSGCRAKSNIYIRGCTDGSLICPAVCAYAGDNTAYSGYFSLVQSQVLFNEKVYSAGTMVPREGGILGDTNDDGIISNAELGLAINSWFNDEISRDDLGTIITYWVA